MAGVSGRRQIVIEMVTAEGRVDCRDVRRQGVVPVRLLGEIVSVIA